MCGRHFCPMKIIEDVRKYAAKQGFRKTRLCELDWSRKRRSSLEPRNYTQRPIFSEAGCTRIGLGCSR
jgi:hypothetical protein